MLRAGEREACREGSLWSVWSVSHALDADQGFVHDLVIHIPFRVQKQAYESRATEYRSHIQRLEVDDRAALQKELRHGGLVA